MAVLVDPLPVALTPPSLLPPLPPGAERGSRRKGVPFAQSKCGTCVALCCRYFALEVDRPTAPADFETLRWFLLHERVNLFVEGRRWFLQVFNRCSALDADNRCTIYATRPTICRTYDNDVCDKDEAQGKSQSDHVFRTVQELETFRDAWVRRYRARQRRERRERRELRQRQARRASRRKASPPRPRRP